MSTLTVNGEEVEANEWAAVLQNTQFLDSVSVTFARDRLDITGHERLTYVEYDYKVTIDGKFHREGTVRGREVMLRVLFYYLSVFENALLPSHRRNTNDPQ